MPEAAPAPAVAPTTPPAKTPVTNFAKPPGETKPAEGKGNDKPAEQPGDDPKELFKKFAKGRTFKHRGAEKSLEELDPDEATEMIRRGFGASELVNEAKKTQTEAQKILAYKKAIEEGDDDAALDAIMQIGGKRGIQLLDRLRGEMAAREKEDEGLSEKERGLAEQLRKAQEESAALKRAEQQRKQEEEERTYKQEEARTKTEAMGKVTELMKVLKGFPAEKAELLKPFIGRAWREVIETGAELGRDVPADIIIKRAEKLFRASTSDFYGALTPAEQFEFLGEEAVRKLSFELVRRNKGGVTPKPATPAPKRPENVREAPQLGDPRYLNR